MIQVYGKKICPFCDLVKNAFNNLGVEYEYLDIEEDQKSKTFIEEQGFKTVPQLYYNDKHYGGSEGVVDLINDLVG